MISFVSEKLLSTLLDLFVGEVLKEVRANLDPKIQEIQNRLNIIESRMDKVQLLHLQSGLTSIRDGRADDALKEFEYAERADDYGAVARFWLSMMLRKRGREKEATAKLDEALSLNPFVVPLEFMGDRRVAKVPLQSFANPKPTKWGKRFDGEGTIMETVPAQESWGRWVWRGVERVVSKDNAQLLVGAVSTSGENPIVQWDVAYGTVPEKFTLFTLLRMEYGTVWRTRRFRDMNLLFAAPKHHVLESASSATYSIARLSTFTASRSVCWLYISTGKARPAPSFRACASAPPTRPACCWWIRTSG